MKTRLTLLLPLLLVSACAGPGQPPPTPPIAVPAAAPVAAAPAASKPKKPGPIPVRQLNVKTECSFRDVSGYNGAMKLAIDAAHVQSFEAKVNIPRHGTCRFDLKDFRQTRQMPNIELSHLRNHCIVRVWEQGERVTVAFQQCQKMCSGNAHDYLWPILNSTLDGSCA